MKRRNFRICNVQLLDVMTDQWRADNDMFGPMVIEIKCPFCSCFVLRMRRDWLSRE
jgi:hypothetical protein